MITDSIKQLLLVATEPKLPPYLTIQNDEETIEVSQLVSKAALLYEKLRYAIDYKEEHLLRRNAIERILKRKLTLNLKSKKIAHSLITELIRANYLPNNRLPARIVVDIQNIIDKYLSINEQINEQVHLPPPTPHWNRLISLAAAEIEQFLFPAKIEQATVNALYQTVKNRLQLGDSELSPNEQNIQIYIACQRSLLKSDEETVFFKLWLIYFPDWLTNNLTGADRKTVAEHFYAIEKAINDQFAHPLNQTITAKLKNYTLYFSIIKEILQKYDKNSSAIFNDATRLNEAAKEIVLKKYQEEQARIKRSSWRAVIYIFFTKIILAFLIELPFDIFVLRETHYLPLGINIIFHPLLLFTMTRSINITKEKNTAAIIAGINNIVYSPDIKKIRLKQKKYDGSILGLIMGFMYLAMFALSFGIIAWILKKLNFNIVSGGLFIMFLTVISYFGIRIRYTAKNWIVQTNVEKTSSFIWDIISLPIIKVGRWLSVKFKSINIFVFILDFIIEAPFKLILEIFEEFVLFLKEKKEEVQ